MGTGDSSLRNGGASWRMPNPVGIAPGANANPMPLQGNPAQPGDWSGAPSAQTDPSAAWRANMLAASGFGAPAGGIPGQVGAPPFAGAVGQPGDWSPGGGKSPVGLKPAPDPAPIVDQAQGPASMTTAAPMPDPTMNPGRTRLANALARRSPMDGFAGYGPRLR